MAFLILFQQALVNQSCEATIPLVIINEKKQTKLIDAVIDTGYTGYLGLAEKVLEKPCKKLMP